jgi:hypothetical protein
MAASRAAMTKDKTAHARGSKILMLRCERTRASKHTQDGANVLRDTPQPSHRKCSALSRKEGKRHQSAARDT